jgi:hypothetical protein
MMSWKEGVVERLVHEAIGSDNVFEKYVTMAKNKRRKSQCTESACHFALKM